VELREQSYEICVYVVALPARCYSQKDEKTKKKRLMQRKEREPKTTENANGCV
jgi:hypothetical protein